MSALINTLGDLVVPQFVSQGWTDIDVTDIFAGAGGSAIGLVAAGLNLKLASNHSRRAIETHATNFRHSEHLIADVTNYDMRKLPHTQVLWASPSCVWHSPAGGHKREEQICAELDAAFDDYVPNEAAERSRATAFDVIRAAEVHRYKVVIVENVVEFATKWLLFDWWVAGLQNLGYTVQLISVSSAHVGGTGNAPAAQWRDRLYLYCTAHGVPVPDVSPRPTAWCAECDEVVAAVQSWRRPNQRKVGKYRQQYDYRCPNARCRYSVVEPFVLPAASIIDWTDLGSRIGDREAEGKRPLVPATMRRIQVGLDMFAEPTMLNVNHGVDEDGRAYPAAAGPFPARTTKTGDGLACPPMLVPAGGGWYDTATSVEQPMRTRTTRDIEGVCTPSTGPQPFITMLRNHAEATGMDEPLATMTTARHHGVTVPPGAFISKHHGGLEYNAISHMNKDVADPMPGLVARPNMSLVIPYRKGRTKTTDESAGLATPAIDINDCHFRMVKPRESARAQRFPDAYVITGNRGEQQLQAGNAVSSNVSQWLGSITVQVLS
jgi:DNA (cytosine-5)-methyltransferase 1